MNALDMSMHGTARRELPDIQPSERALLGSLIMSPNAVDRVPDWFEPGYFAVEAHAVIFDKAVELVRSGGFANPVLIKGALPDEKIGERKVSTYISELCGEALGELVVPSLCGAIYQHWKRRARIQAAAMLEQSAYDDALDIPERIDALRDAFEKTVENRESEARNLRPGDAYIETFNASSSNSGAVGVSIGLKAIRKVLNESVFEAGNLYGLLSSSGEGKTSLTVQIILHALQQGHPVIFLSYDESSSQIVRRMIAIEHGIDLHQQRDPENLMREGERLTCVQFSEWINNQPFEVIRCRREGIGQLVGYARKFVKRYGNGRTPLIVLDHIGKVKPRDPRLSPDRIAGEVTVELKAFADESKSAVLVLNQRNSEGMKRTNPRPISRDLYGGDGAKQDYDAIAYLYRPAKYRKDMYAVAADDRERGRIAAVFAEFGTDVETVAEVGVIKCRFGDPSQKDTLEFDARFQRYKSMEPVEPQGRLM